MSQETKEHTMSEYQPIKADDVLAKIENYKKEMEQITVSKTQAEKEKEEIINDIIANKMPEDIREIYPVIDALAFETGHDVIILRRWQDAEFNYFWEIDFKQAKELGVGDCDGTLLVIVPDCPANISKNTAIYVDKSEIRIDEFLEGNERIAQTWGNSKQQILETVSEKIDALLKTQRDNLHKMQSENKELKGEKTTKKTKNIDEEVLKDDYIPLF